MKIAVASGKGGTGKTTVATNLAMAASSDGMTVSYVDCDVEEPNGGIFLKPQITGRSDVCVPVPQVDAEMCNHCGKCGDICQFNAIVVMGEQVLVFDQLCHSCGGCYWVCPQNAITERQREIGTMETGRAGDISFTQGMLNIGEAMSPPLIRRIKVVATNVDLAFFDAPPGTSCPVIQSVEDADFVILVTEPTPFGLHDLKLAVKMVGALKLPFGVVINRAGVGDDRTHEFCRSENIEILAEIPDDRKIAEAYSRGEMIFDAAPQFAHIFTDIVQRASELADGTKRDTNKSDNE